MICDHQDDNGFGQYCIIDLDENSKVGYYRGNELVYPVNPYRRHYKNPMSSIPEAGPCKQMNGLNDHVLISTILGIVGNVKTVAYSAIGVCTAGALLVFKNL
jgi:hypothetical protein|tara:strand:+ start:92 stop:397 length:306 start_codon:yes stop_codon:yes gene_type:complete